MMYLIQLLTDQRAYEEILTLDGEHHEIDDGGRLMMTTAMDSPLRSPERTPDQPSRESLGLGGGSVS